MLSQIQTISDRIFKSGLNLKIVDVKGKHLITPENIAKSGSEHAHQTALFQWAALNRVVYPQLKWLFAVPNGFFSTSAQKAKMKAEGLKDGVLDVWLPIPIQYDFEAALYHGLIIEMKIEKRRKEKNGGCSEDQLEWLDYLNSAGYKAVVCYGWEEARNAILEYLNG